MLEGVSQGTLERGLAPGLHVFGDYFLGTMEELPEEDRVWYLYSLGRAGEAGWVQQVLRELLFSGSWFRNSCKGFLSISPDICRRDLTEGQYCN